MSDNSWAIHIQYRGKFRENVNNLQGKGLNTIAYQIQIRNTFSHITYRYLLMFQQGALLEILSFWYISTKTCFSMKRCYPAKCFSVRCDACQLKLHSKQWNICNYKQKIYHFLDFLCSLFNMISQWISDLP